MLSSYYLTALSVIGARGVVPGLEVELPSRLRSYALPAPTNDIEAARAAVRASLALLELVPDMVGAAVLAAVYCAPLGRTTVTTWLKGVTGTNKTTFLALGLAHYGKEWTRDHLPEGWHSSANALEQVAHLVKDALFVIDDFKPEGGPRERKEMQAKAARIIHGAADGGPVPLN